MSTVCAHRKLRRLSSGGTERTRTVIGLIDNQVPHQIKSLQCPSNKLHPRWLGEGWFREQFAAILVRVVKAFTAAATDDKAGFTDISDTCGISL